MNPNQDILNAIGGIGALPMPTTMGTGVPSIDNPSANPVGGQLPQMTDQLGGNAGYMNTIQRFFNGPQSTFGSPIQTPIRHTQGRDSWSSAMGLDHQTILKNIGLGANNG